MEVASGGSLERLSALLLSPKVGKKEKLAALKAVASRRSDLEAGKLLQSAAALKSNGPILKYIVRTFGYTGLPEAVRWVKPYVGHSNPGVVSNALKALAMIDRVEAVRQALPVLRKAGSEASMAAAKILAMRCRTESRAAIDELSRSVLANDRLAAVTYTRFLEPAEALPMMLDMLRAETLPELSALLIKLLPRTATKSDAPVLEGFARELKEKLDAIGQTLKVLPDTAEIERPDSGPDGLTQLELAIPADAALSSEALDPRAEIPPETFLSNEIERPDLEEAISPVPVEPSGPVPEPAAGVIAERAPEQVPGPEPAESALAPAASEVEIPPDIVSKPRKVRRESAVIRTLSNLVLPWMRKAKLKKEQPQQDGAPSGPATIDRTIRAKPLVSVAVMSGVAYVLFLIFGGAGAEVEQPRIEGPTECSLGRVGATVRFKGQVVQVDREYNVVVVKNDENVLVSAYFTDMRLPYLSKERATIVEGVVKEIKSERVIVLKGTSINQS